MITYPNAKVNIGLNIVGKRADGFHNIESVFYPIPWRDVLEIVQVSGTGKADFTSSGIEIPKDGNLNLCEKVYRTINGLKPIPSVKIHLHKIIPIGAGMGGGSSDAAFTALMLNEMFALGFSVEKLEGIVADVGSDCPFFIQNRPAFVSGRGELLEPFKLELKGCWMALINPQVHIGSREAYTGVSPNQPSVSLKSVLIEDVSEWQNTVINDFEASVFPKHPEIRMLKEKMYADGAKYSSMTGSGSTVYGIFDHYPALKGIPSLYQSKIVRL